MTSASRAFWLDDARRGSVLESDADDAVRVRLTEGTRILARRSQPMRAQGIALRAGDTVLLARADDGSWQVARRFRFEEGREAPLLIPTVDPTVEYLLRPGQPEWTHPYKAPMYDWYDAFDEDLPNWRRLAAEEGDPVLELACGAGRVSLDLARAGHRVTGVDLSRAMLDLAETRRAVETPEVRERLTWIHADMSEWRSDERFRMAFIACNGLHYMGSARKEAAIDLRRAAVEALYQHLEPGGLGVISNIARLDDEPLPPARPSPYLLLTGHGLNPNTGRWTSIYQGRHLDPQGRRYDGPWRFVEELEDGGRRAFEFALPPEDPEALRMPARPPTLTRDETVALMREAGFVDVQLRSPEDLLPVDDTDWAVLFSGRRP